MKIKTRKRDLQSEYILSQYKKENGTEGLNPSSVVDWARERGIALPVEVDPFRQLRQDLVRFLRSQTVRDGDGNTIRLNHPVVMTDGKRKFSVWEEITTAPAKHMQTSLAQRRIGIMADCRQHKLDLDYYNENNVHGAKLPEMSYNFEVDNEELGFPTDYPDEKPQ